MRRLSWSVWALLALLFGGAVGCLAPAFGADEKPLVISATTGRQEQLQSGNNLTTPVGSLVKITDTTATTSSATGALLVTGGSAIGGAVRSATGFGVSANPSASQPVNIFGTNAGNFSVNIMNNSGAATAGASYSAANDGGATVTFGINSSGYGTYGIFGNNSSIIYAPNTAGIAIMADNASGAIKLAAGGNAQSARLVAASTAASSSITGTFVVGDGSTTGTNVSMGGGLLYTGGRSFLGTIGSTFKGNVVAGVQDATASVAGQVGEEIKSTVSAVAVASTGTVGNVTSINLTAGDWLVSGYFTVAGGATGLTSTSTVNCSIVTTTATNGTLGDTMQQQSIAALVANGLQSMSIPAKRVNINTTTTYYLTEQVTFAAGSPTVSGTLTATRIR